MSLGLADALNTLKEAIDMKMDFWVGQIHVTADSIHTDRYEVSFWPAAQISARGPIEQAKGTMVTIEDQGRDEREGDEIDWQTPEVSSPHCSHSSGKS